MTTKADAEILWADAFTDLRFVLEAEAEAPSMENRFRQLDFFKDRPGCAYYKNAVFLCYHDLKDLGFKFDDSGTITSPKGRLLWPRKS